MLWQNKNWCLKQVTLHITSDIIQENKDAKIIGTNKGEQLNNVYMVENNNLIFHSNNVAISPFRCYFVIDGANNSDMSIVTAVSIPNSIETIENNDAKTNEIYTITGVKMPKNAKLKKGIYIINGKKTVIK